MSAFLRPVSNAVVVRVNTTCLPSGEIRGSETRTAVIKSSIVIGRVVCANEESAETIVIINGKDFLINGYLPTVAAVYMELSKIRIAEDSPSPLWER